MSDRPLHNEFASYREWLDIYNIHHTLVSLCLLFVYKMDTKGIQIGNALPYRSLVTLVIAHLGDSHLKFRTR